MSEKISVRLRRPTVNVDDLPWHTMQAWWPTLEAILSRGHTVAVALFRELPSDVIGVQEDPFFGRYVDIVSGTGRARVFGQRTSVRDEQLQSRYMLAVLPPGIPLPSPEEVSVMLAAAKAPQGIES